MSGNRTLRGLATWDEGFAVVGTGLWLDPRHRVEFGFASDALGEAHADRVVATPETVRFLRRWRRRPTYLPSPLGRPFAVGEAVVELHPAGSLPGAAQIVLRRRGVTALYFRRILPEPVGLGEPLDVPRADAVLVDAPGGFPPRACARRADTLLAVRAWVEDVLGQGRIPVVLAEPVVAAPAVVAHLEALGCEVRLHPTLYARVRFHVGLGFAMGRALRLRTAARAGQVVVLPLGGKGRGSGFGVRGSGTGDQEEDPLARVVGAEGGPGRRDQIRTAVVHEGTAALPGGLRPDETFPIAFRAGVPEIVAHVQRTGAAEAFLAPGTPAAVGTILRDLGIAAVTRSGPPEQLGLGGGR